MAPGSRLQELTAQYMRNPRRFFVSLANEYRQSGDLDRAIALCREHLPAQPGHMSGHIVLGRAYHEKGDHQAAHEAFLTSVALDDENIIALRHLGDIARDRSDVNEARGWYTRILDADPDNRDIVQLLGALDSSPTRDGEELNRPAAVADGAVPVNRTDASTASLTAEVDAAAVDAAGAGPLTSALDDPTPPGLRAILGAGPAPRFDADLVPTPDLPPPSATRPLESSDLATLPEVLDLVPDVQSAGIDAYAVAPPAAEAFGITVEGGGFGFGDLDELVDPAVAGSLPDTLPPAAEADFSTGTEMLSAAPTASEADDILSRPVFGALASFASWRTAQARETPSSVPAQSPAAPPPTPDIAADESDLSWDDGTNDASATAPEFVTETMAALYARQGFARQALDVYRVLLARNPGDAGLSMKVLELQAVLEAPSVDAALEADADEALEFGASDAVSSDASHDGSSSGTAGDSGSVWSGATEANAAGGDDWFTAVPESDPLVAFVDSDAGMFGFVPDRADADVRDGAPARSGDTSNRAPVALAMLLGEAAVSAADESAAAMLSALAIQMVGRLSKEPPTLPVPDILELPASVAGDRFTGASPAPLLSFDRFFSGNGSPPRPRVDTPVRTSVSAPRDVSAVPPVVPASLSPTFGGVPVISTPTSAPAPLWAGFDRFMSPATGIPSQPDAPLSAPTSPTPTGAFWTPASVPVIPGTPSPTAPPIPKPVTPPVSFAQPVAPPTPPQQKEAPAEAPRRNPPSDFHRWLEGLS